MFMLKSGMVFLWLRKLIRKNTRPIQEQTATLWKQRFSLAYALLAWNAFGYICYMIHSGKADWSKYYGYRKDELEETPAQFWTKSLGIKDATVYRVQGLKMKRYEIHNEFKEDEEQATNSEEEVANTN